jgi:hypothetical protein
MPKKFNQQICDVVGALDSAGVPVKEIERRLNEGEAGLDHKVKISTRTIYEYRQRAREQITRKKALEDPAAHSIAALKLRIRERYSQEIDFYERIPPGKLTSEQRTALHHVFIKLDDIQRREAIADRRPGRTGKDGPASTTPDKPESAVERLAREQREAGEDAP